MKRLLQLAVLILFIAALAYYGVYFGLTNPRLEKLEKKSQELINRLSLLKPQVGLNTEELKQLKEMIEKKVTLGSSEDNFLLIDEDAETLDGYDSTAFALAHLHPYLNLSGGVMMGDIIWNSTQTFGNATLVNLNELVSGASTTLHAHPGVGLWADNLTYIYPTNVGTSFQILDTGGLTVAGPINGATTITATGLITGGSFSGDGSSLTSLNASQLSSGTVPSARISGSYTGITGVGTIASGTWQGTAITNAYVADDLTISGGIINNTPIGAITPSTGAFTTGSFSGQAAFNYNLGAPFTVLNSTVVTNLNADLLDGFQASDFASAGTYVSLQATTPGTQQTGNINVSGTVIGGTFSGSGASLTSLNASNLSSGTVPSARVSGSYTGITGVGTIATGTWNADVIADAYIANDLTISGGTINSTPIGSTTPSTGAFTTVASPSYTGTGAVTLSSGGTSDLTLDAAGNLILADANIDLTGGTTVTLRRNSATSNLLALDNIGAGSLSLNLVDGALQTAGVTRISNAGAGTLTSLDVASGGITNAGSITGVGANISGTGALTIASGGTGQLTLDSASGTVALASGDSLSIPGNLTVSGTSNVIPYIYGSTAASGNLTLESTSNATKGYVILQPTGGNVGIGTPTPGYALEVEGSGTTASTEYLLGGFDQVTSAGGAYLGYYVGAGGAVQEGRFRAGGNIPLALGTTAYPQAIYVLNSNGNVGIGTTNPTSRLYVTTDTGTGEVARINSGGVTNSQVLAVDFSGGNVGSTAETAALLRITTNSTFRPLLSLVPSAGTGVIVTATGNVGIGTTSPGISPPSGTNTGLTITNSAGFGYLELAANVTTDLFVGEVTFVNQAITAAEKRLGLIVSRRSGANNSGTLEFWNMSAGTLGEKMRITPAGNVGIGTTNPAAAEPAVLFYP